MGELSDRFAALMARLAKSDAELFRTVGEQNAAVRGLVDDLTAAVDGSSEALASTPLSPAPAALAPAGLLSPEACELPALKARFGKVAVARAWLEGQIGPAPKTPTWAVIAQTCRTGAWPEAPRRRATPPDALSTVALDARLTALEQRLGGLLDQRFSRLEHLLAGLVAAIETRSPADENVRRPVS
ncbi:MAG: hypothetical protein VKP63_01035 [Cyanobacteriota bacterium]|nr:hypothetical protein [Cyanobacteriota bacterium]